MATQTNLSQSVDSHLRRIGSSLPEFLKAGVERGLSADGLSAELRRLTEIHVANRTLYRWMDQLGIPRPDLRSTAS